MFGHTHQPRSQPPSVTVASCSHQPPHCLWLGTYKNRGSCSWPTLHWASRPSDAKHAWKEEEPQQWGGWLPILAWDSTEPRRRKAPPRRKKGNRRRRRNITPCAPRAIALTRATDGMQRAAVGTQGNSIGPWRIYLLRHGVRPRCVSPPKDDVEPMDIDPPKHGMGPMSVNPPRQQCGAHGGGSTSRRLIDGSGSTCYRHDVAAPQCT